MYLVSTSIFLDKSTYYINVVYFDTLLNSTKSMSTIGGPFVLFTYTQS